MMIIRSTLGLLADFATTAPTSFMLTATVLALLTGLAAQAALGDYR